MAHRWSPKPSAAAFSIGDYTPKVQWTLTVFVLGVWTGCSFSVRHRVVLPLQTLSHPHLLAALREKDPTAMFVLFFTTKPTGKAAARISVCRSDVARLKPSRYDDLSYSVFRSRARS